MSIIEQENKLESLVKARIAFLTEVKQECNLNDEDYNNIDVIEDEILSGELFLEWFDQRDLAYINDMIGCQQALLKTLKVAENEDKKSLNNANKTFCTQMSHLHQYLYFPRIKFVYIAVHLFHWITF